MKRILCFILIMIISFNTVIAFDILDSQNNNNKYFNIENDKVKVKTLLNVSVMKVEYNVSQKRTQIYPFLNCNSSYKCSSLNLTELVESNGDSYENTIKFSIIVNDTIENIYLDTIDPEFNLNDYDINRENNKINFNFNYTDDTGVEELKIYEKQSGNLIFLDSGLKNNYVYENIEDDSYIFVFKVSDMAGNFDSYEKEIDVGDVSNPVISDVIAIRKLDNSYDLEFDISDNNKISKYKVKQDDIILEEKVNSKNYENTIKIPFTNGKIDFLVYDTKNNQKKIVIDLDEGIDNSYQSKFSNNKYFKFISSADKCVLTELNGNNEDEDFDLDSDEFSLKLDIKENQESQIEFFCEKDHIREYFQKDFFYDTQKPDETNLELESSQNGFLNLKWNESKDNQSDVDYVLYKNNKIVYSGSDLEYVDKKVSYPNEYEYYLRVVDRAGNYFETETLKKVPEKVNINFNVLDFEKTVEDQNYDFNFQTEKNVDVVIEVRNNGKIFLKDNFKTTQNDINLNIDLKEGQNIIYLSLLDDFDNVLEKEFSVIYEKEELVLEDQSVDDNQQNLDSQQQDDNVSGIISSPINSSDTDNEKEETISYNWIYFVVLILIFLYFVWCFIIKEDCLDLKNKKISNKNKRALDKQKKYDNKFFTFKRNKDKVLEKDFNRIKNQRIKKQEERKYEELKKKKLEEKEKSRSDLQKQKHKDLGDKKREFNIPLSQRKKAKKRVEKIKNEVDYDKELEKSNSNEDKKSGFLKRKGDRKKTYDEMDSYLQRFKSSNGWDSTRDYILKEEIKNEIPPQESKENILEDNQKSQTNFNDEGLNNKEEGNEFKSNQNKNKRGKKEKNHLDDYLSNILKKKKRKKFFMAEREVDKRLKDL